ncbi:hypothetical protein N0V92_005898 [Colletotrichum tropicale]|nr:hypothetical protein N0V92_005898 [Colletotrichum tropicale]
MPKDKKGKGRQDDIQDSDTQSLASEGTSLATAGRRAMLLVDILGFEEMAIRSEMSARFEGTRSMSRSDQRAEEKNYLSQISEVHEMKKALSGKNREFFSGVRIKDTDQPYEVLMKTLSIRAALTTEDAKKVTESFARQNRQGSMFTCIGRGTSGSVFALTGTSLAIKKNNGDPNQLWTDWKCGKEVATAVYTVAIPILQQGGFEGAEVPRIPTYGTVHGFSKNENDEWWQTYGKRFPQTEKDRHEAPLYTMERILSLPFIVRHALIDKYWDEQKRHIAHASMDRACLIRPFLRRNLNELENAVYKSIKEERTRTTRNFPFFLNEMRELKIDPNFYAKDMALGLAILHFVAGFTGQDIEFLIGSRRINPTEHKNDLSHENPESRLFRNRGIQLWMVDFGQCETLDFGTTPGEEQEAIMSLMGYKCRLNEDYYPCYEYVHKEEDREVFFEFAKTYIKAGEKLIEQRHRQLGTTPEEVKRLMAIPRKVM